MDIAEKMAADIALAMDGGEWKDGKWYSKFHRDAWIKAVKPYADEIERLREALRLIPKTITDAADEIERLRKALTELDRGINQWLPAESVIKKSLLKIIADALKEGE